jgi:voltage-gated potassium channel Kch
VSTPFPVQVGTNYKDSFYLKDKTTNAPITGKVQGDFTIRISRGTTGNISTTGFTITEVSAGNNPGQYDVVGSGATGFTATTAGKCLITIRLTADDAYSFEQTVLVTANGDYDGTSGAASFTATANDGRITDGTNPLTGATVRLRNSTNTIVAQLTTDASGLWGPVYLDATVTIDAQKSGYSVNNSNSVTVVGSTATGPATDVALTAVTSSSSILNSDLTSYARVQIRNQSGSQSDTTIQQIVNNAVRWVATAKFWNYYKTHGDFTLREPYSTGTIALTAGSTTCTLTTGTWPTWAASGKLKIGSKVYRIASRTSGSVVVLATAWAEDAETAATYLIFQDEYSLASDCLKFGELFPGANWGWGGAASSFESVLRAQSSLIQGQAYPSQWATHGSGGTAKLIVWPYPSSSEDVLCAYWYYRMPALLVSAGDTVDCDPLWIELLHRSIDYQIAPRYEAGVAGRSDPVYKQLMECFDRFAINDKGPLNPTGPLGSYRATGPLQPRLTG